MVKGAKTANSNGHTHETNILLKRAGLRSHQMNMAARGPKNKSDVTIQHILYLK